MFSVLIAATVMVQARPTILVFSKTAGYRHDSIETGVRTIRELGRENGFNVRHSEDAAVFTDANLKQYKALVFVCTTGDILDDAQQTAMASFMRAGGGWMGIHAAADTEYDWPWYGDLVGGWFKSHPAIQDARVQVVDRNHISTKHLPEVWMRRDEWYDYKSLPPAGTRILMQLDESSYKGHKMELGSHPIAWCREFDGGRSFYTGGGHTKESYDEPNFRKHVLGGILWVLRME